MTEPSSGAVVLDAAGYAWQRDAGQWHAAVDRGWALPWDELERRGPIVLLHSWSWDEMSEP